MIVKSILDFVVGTIDLPSSVCTLYPCPDDVDATDPQMDCTLQSGLKARAQQRTTHQTVFGLCSVCVCVALKKKKKEWLHFHSVAFPWGSGGTGRDPGIGNLSKSALS